MSVQPVGDSGLPQRVRVPRTIAAVRQSLPEHLRAQFTVELRDEGADHMHVFETWWNKALCYANRDRVEELLKQAAAKTLPTITAEQAFGDKWTVALAARTTR